MTNLGKLELYGCFPSCRSPGRPLLAVSIEDIEYLRSLQFSWTKIAQILGISRSTLYRRLEESGIQQDVQYTSISDFELDRAVEYIKNMHPNDGERLLIGHLRRMEIVVPRARVRGSIHRVDPVSTALRRSIAIRRRTYWVSGPNALWHIDGHHKLIRWRFVTHGGIDGYSRTITYLKCSTNNEASTVVAVFCDAVRKYGLPECVRSDRGGENIEVWRYMVQEHSSHSAIVTGSSTHNERIERLWRDVYRCVGVIFHNLFRTMEDEGHLDCLNEVDIFCLHYTFLPRINQTLDSFIESWTITHCQLVEILHLTNYLFKVPCSRISLQQYLLHSPTLQCQLQLMLLKFQGHPSAHATAFNKSSIR